jgi:erythromycin esterase-like protein
MELRRLLTQDAADGMVNPRLFSAFQNARIVKNAELYHRLDGDRSWNARDRHMVDTIDDAADHLITADRKVVVWAHNSHQGDARATSLGESGQWNVGDLMRRRHGDAALLIGFTTHSGTVFASRQWGEDGWVRDVRPAIGGSIERLFHEVGVPAFVILFRGERGAAALLEDERWERAIGVQYLPETERVSHYFKVRVPQQFDAVIHIDTTRAISPLDAGAHDDR